MTRATKRVWFFVVPGSEVLDVAGPWSVFGHANDVLGRPAYELELRGVTDAEVRTRHGLSLSRVKKLPRHGSQLPDLGIVAGGSPLEPLPVAESALATWLASNRVATLASICTGAFVLGSAGLLHKRRVTTHWRFLAELQRRFPSAKVVGDGVFVRDRRLWTSAGISAGIDLTLALVEEDHGHEVAMAVAKELVLFLRRNGSQAQFSATLQRQRDIPPTEPDIASFVLEHLGEPLPIERLARALAMSPRSLSRWCRARFDESPAQVVRHLRIDEARRLLESTQLPLKDIAARTALGDTSTLWRVFTHRVGVTPAAYRERFAHLGPMS
jgi:transcriptional regulator GlxA family with amidase domain